MYGAGAHVFAVMSYVISHMQPDKDREEYVRLNPALLADVIGEDEVRILAAIDFLCQEDKETTSPDEEGRRLVLKSPYIYWVVNGRHYRELKDEEDRLEKAAIRQQRYRDRKSGVVSPPKKTGFEPPTIEMVKLNCAKIGLPDTEAAHFMDYYGANGWKVNGKSMRSWQSSMISWRKNWQERNGGNGVGGIVVRKETKEEENRRILNEAMG